MQDEKYIELKNKFVGKKRGGSICPLKLGDFWSADLRLADEFGRLPSSQKSRK
jgi:hypothetical protein